MKQFVEKVKSVVLKAVDAVKYTFAVIKAFFVGVYDLFKGSSKTARKVLTGLFAVLGILAFILLVGCSSETSTTKDVSSVKYTGGALLVGDYTPLVSHNVFDPYSYEGSLTDVQFVEKHEMYAYDYLYAEVDNSGTVYFPHPAGLTKEELLVEGNKALKLLEDKTDNPFVNSIRSDLLLVYATYYKALD